MSVTSSRELLARNLLERFIGLIRLHSRAGGRGS